jgi:uncharacterized protein YjbJ (UPF0337 family)
VPLTPRTPLTPSQGLVDVRTREAVVGWPSGRRRKGGAGDTMEDNAVGLDDKMANKADDLRGKLKEGAGRATDDEQLEAEGRGEQATSDLKQAGEKVKDAFKH